MTSYPAQIDTNVTLPIVLDNSTPVSGDTVNRLRTAIIAIERELGVKPSGPYASIRNRLDVIENIITSNMISLAGDLGGTVSVPLVIGIRGRPISNATPLLNQTLTWDGIIWKPSYTSTQPVITSADIAFISGAQLSSSNTPSAIGGRNVDMTPFIPVLGDGRIRSVRVYVDVEVSGTGIDGYAQLYDVTHDVAVTGTTFRFTSVDVAELASAELTVGSDAGNIRSDEVTYYELRLWKVSLSGSDRSICHSARLTISYD